nr:bulb-type lectin domain-containing protein [Tanacetum cinerariifolium]
MLKKKIKEIEVYNSSISQDKYKQYNCFYCNQKGHVVKACPTKIKDEASYPQGQTVGFEERSRDVNNITQAKINKNKDMVMCFKCQKHGHFANRCPTKEHVASTNEAGQPKSLDKERTNKKGKEPMIVENTDTSEVHTFQEYVAFLNLIKDDDETSKEWDTYRNRFDKFGQEFGALAEVLGLTRSDGEEIRKCYMTYLEVFISYYKTTRAPEDPMRGGEDLESLEEYQWNFGKGGASFAVKKGKKG